MSSRLLAAAAAAAFLAAGAAHAQGYGYGPPPPYASDPAYEGAQVVCDRDGFTLAGARAGITVLGVNLDGGAGVRLSAGDRHCRAAGGYAPSSYAPPPPEPAYAQPGYGQDAYAPPSYGQPVYAPPAPVYYSQPTYAPPAPPYGAPYAQTCGCAGAYGY